MIGGEKGRVGS